MGSTETPGSTARDRIDKAVQDLRLKLLPDQLELFIAGRAEAETLRQLQAIASWLGKVNTQNHDGVMLTPALVRFLAEGEGVEGRLAELSRLRAETREGRFDAGNELQRELEYKRFWSEARNHRDWPQEEEGQRSLFNKLAPLPPQEKDLVCALSDEDAHEVKRAALEAVGLFEFLREFRANTSRPITVFGNDRYGRIYLVEPLEPYLGDQFEVLYERVPSHGSMRLTVPDYAERFHRSGFAPQVIERISAQMPHMVLVDVCSPRATESYTKMPRGLRDLVNWFMVFNHIRSGGDRSSYENKSGLPPSNIAELEKWWEFEVVRRRIGQWIEPGATYAISHWGPELMEEVLMGDLVVPAKPAVFGDDPQAVVANPGLYRTEGEDLSDVLRTTTPYHFNDPEKRVAETIVPGFGEHGFETRVSGFTTDEYVRAVQDQMAVELGAMLGNP